MSYGTTTASATGAVVATCTGAGVIVASQPAAQSSIAAAKEPRRSASLARRAPDVKRGRRMAWIDTGPSLSGVGPATGVPGFAVCLALPVGAAYEHARCSTLSPGSTLVYTSEESGGADGTLPPEGTS